MRGMGIERPVIIIVSANLNETHLAPAPDRVHDGYLIKPVNIASLLDTIGGLLKLEWRHEPIGAAARGAKGAVIIPPAASHIEELRHLGQIGHVRGIQAKLDEIERSSPASRPFVARMRQIAQTYDFRRFNSEIERLQSRNDR